MGIERGGHAASHRALAVPPAGGHGKAAAQPAATGDFLALLAMLEDGGSGLMAGLADDTEPAPDGAGEGERVAADPAALAAAGGMPLPQAQAQPGPQMPAEPGGAMALASGPGILPGAAAMVRPEQPVAQPDASAADASATVPQPASSGAAARPQADLQSVAAAATTPVDPHAVPEYASVFAQLRQHLAAREAAAGSSAAPMPATGAQAALAAAAARGSARAEAAGAAPMPALRAEAVQTPPALAVGSGASMAGGQEGGGAAGQHGAPHHGAAPWAQAAFTPTVQYDAALAAPVGGMQADGAFEQQLTEQLRHWVSQGVHSAELTVGTQDPVQVRIALDGNEAQLQFRAEHAATREMLAGTVEQLRDLLAAQGLVLSGMSVGAGGAGARGQGGEGTPGEGAARRGTAEAAEQAPLQETLQARRGSGALDLYV